MYLKPQICVNAEQQAKLLLQRLEQSTQTPVKAELDILLNALMHLIFGLHV